MQRLIKTGPRQAKHARYYCVLIRLTIVFRGRSGVCYPSCRHLLLLLTSGDLRVLGLAIALSGGCVFGGKYVVAGYANRAASFNDNLFFRNTRSTTLCRTFATN